MLRLLRTTALVATGALVSLVTISLAGSGFGRGGTKIAVLGGHCAIAAMGGGHHDAGKGALAEGCGVLLEYVFDHFPMHKVFLEMPEYNARLLGGSMEGIAALEGEISDYYFFAGRRWSKQIYSISREHWASVVSDHLPSWDHS